MIPIPSTLNISGMSPVTEIYVDKSVVDALTPLRGLQFTPPRSAVVTKGPDAGTSVPVYEPIPAALKSLSQIVKASIEANIAKESPVGDSLSQLKGLCGAVAKEVKALGGRVPDRIVTSLFALAAAINSKYFKSKGEATSEALPYLLEIITGIPPVTLRWLPKEGVKITLKAVETELFQAAVQDNLSRRAAASLAAVGPKGERTSFSGAHRRHFTLLLATAAMGSNQAQATIGQLISACRQNGDSAGAESWQNLFGIAMGVGASPSSTPSSQTTTLAEYSKQFAIKL